MLPVATSETISGLCSCRSFSMTPNALHQPREKERVQPISFLLSESKLWFAPFRVLFATDLSKFSFTLNFTILLTRLKGIGLSKGNCTEHFDPSYADSSSRNYLLTIDDAYIHICYFITLN